MENFYKFIPVIFWLLYKAYKANKLSSKKTQQFPKSSPKPNKRKKTAPKLPSFDEILREMMDEKTKETPKKEVFEEVEMEYDELEFEDQEVEYFNEQDSKSENEDQTDTETVLVDLGEEISEIQSIQVDEETKSSFDLKSAIIAETILNRPEY